MLGYEYKLSLMIFALATDERSLMVFADAASAIAYCEGIDVEDGVWEFWGPEGEALEAVFSRPNERTGSWVLSGVYTLHPCPTKQGLLASLPGIDFLKTNPHFSSLADVADQLAQGSKLQQYRA
jgi:hypothetical protein